MKILLILLVALIAINNKLFAAEAGMPQLDPKYWASQIFWLILVFSTLYLSISKIFLPKIKSGLDDRENKIKNDLDEAKKLKELSEEKQAEYRIAMENGNKFVLKITLEAKKKLDLEVQNKKSLFEKEIAKEINDTQGEIDELKKNSINNIIKISEEISANIIKEISGEKMNESSIKASVEEVSKKNMGKYL